MPNSLTSAPRFPITNQDQMFSFYLVSILALLSLQPAVGMPATNCTLASKPVERALIGKKATGMLFCSRSGDGWHSHSVRIEHWGVVYESGAGSMTAAVYTRGKKTPMLQYRFKASEPMRNIMAWGKDRDEFNSELRSIRSQIEGIRHPYFASCDQRIQKTFSKADLDARINHDRITTAALTFLAAMEFNSYLGVCTKTP